MAPCKVARCDHWRHIFRLFSLLQLTQNAAVASRPICVAVTPKLIQLVFQHIQLANPGLNMMKMLIYQSVHRSAVCIWLTARLQQYPDFTMRHIKRPAATDKHQSLQMRAVIMPVVVCLVAYCRL
ncbi:hypothetical protein HA46_10475 [Pantoea septica]|uniref:Secreted protein n=1 Tax=Pantoea septica TaxID=472695 RepID=A0ABX3USD0_9GAMM|nr:hypothetical protein HA46_10475 [Pantoea septica]